jgi:predicted nucleic-acid-binding Zn-ribbon protein
MKNGKCPMCESTEVYMTDSFGTLRARSDRLHFQAMQGSNSAVFNFDVYVCTDCGFTAMYAKSDTSLDFLKKADLWRRAG